MKPQDAFNILGIPNGNVTPDDITKAYRAAAMKYHPDRNPAGLEMMKLINAAKEALNDFTSGESASNSHDYGEKINTALNAIVELGLTIEVCGAWVWVTGDTKTHREILKSAGFYWAQKKLAWYFRPEEYKCHRSRGSLTLDKIRSKYGSQTVNNKQEEKRSNYLGKTPAA